MSVDSGLVYKPVDKKLVEEFNNNAKSQSVETLNVLKVENEQSFDNLDGKGPND